MCMSIDTGGGTILSPFIILYIIIQDINGYSCVYINAYMKYISDIIVLHDAMNIYTYNTNSNNA